MARKVPKKFRLDPAETVPEPVPLPPPAPAPAPTSSGVLTTEGGSPLTTEAGARIIVEGTPVG